MPRAVHQSDFTHDPDAGREERFTLSPVVAVAMGLVLALTLVLPWFFGGVWATVQAGAALALAAALVGLLIAALGAERWAIVLPWGVVPVLGGIVLAVVQLLPLPVGLASALSPLSTELRLESTNVAAEATQPLSLYPASTRRDLVMLLLAGSMFILGASLFWRSVTMRWLFAVLAVNGALLGFFGIVQQLSSEGTLYWSVPLSQGGVPFGPFVNRNNAGGYLNLCLAGALGALVWAFAGRERSAGTLHIDRRENLFTRCQTGLMNFLASLDGPRLFALSAVGLIVAGILCSLSRGATVAMFGATGMTLLTLGIVTRRMGAALLIFAAMIVGPVLVAWGGKADKVENRLATLSELTEIDDYRLPHWQDSLTAIPDYWLLGSGLGTYRFVYRQYERGLTTQSFYHAENQYLEALLEGGVAGGGLLLAAIVLVGLAVIYLFRHDPLLHPAIAVAGLYALSSAAISSCFDFGLYLPANMLLMALLCGAVTGRAAMIARRRRARHRGAHRAAPALAVCGPLLSTALLLGCVFGAFELRRAAAAEELFVAPERDSQTLWSEEELATRQARLEQFAEALPHDAAEAQYELAQQWIELARQQILQTLREQSAGDVPTEQLHELTSLANLHASLWRLKSEGHADRAARLRAQPAFAETLSRAWEHLELAQRACPIYAEVYLQLARLAPALDVTEREAELVEQALRRAPRNARILFHAGQLDWQAGRVERACASWKTSLELSPRYERPILQQTTSALPLRQVVDELLPADAQRLIDIVQREYWRPEAGVQRHLVLARAEKLLAAETDLPADERLFREATLLAAQGDRAAAATRFAEAIQLRPSDHAWRHRYARLLFEQGKLDEALEQAAACVRLYPESDGYRKFVEQISQRRVQQVAR